jgi:hypothetical protein
MPRLTIPLFTATVAFTASVATFILVFTQPPAAALSSAAGLGGLVLGVDYYIVTPVLSLLGSPRTSRNPKEESLLTFVVRGFARVYAVGTLLFVATVALARLLT